ncbi:hypothetical protein TNCV_2789831 [Trichonephila clavipes]|nr:hypothetical protein TNCV_2789831 [Trichonephila clavipes]
MLQENASSLSSYKRRLERLAGILKFQELLEMYPVPVKVVKNENGFHITDCVWSTENCTEEPKDVSSDYVEQEASKGAFIQALWMPNPAYTVWHIRLGNDRVRKTDHVDSIGSSGGCYAEKWPDTVFQVPDVCSICPMHWPEKTHCGHGFHLQCLLQHLDARGALNTFHSSWTRLMPSRAPFYHGGAVTLPDKPDALEYAARQGQIRAGIIYQEPSAKRAFVLFSKDHWHQKRRGWTISNGPSWRQSMSMNLDPTT